MTSFHERQKNLFSQLQDAEEQHSFSKTNKATDSQDYGVIDRHTYKKLKSEMKPFRGKESIYKKSQANIRQCLRARTIPDFMKNPNRWVYYSLSDVTVDQMSDATNTATALAIMQGIEEKHDDVESKVDPDDLIFKKPAFNISVAIKKPSEPEDEKTVFKNNKLVMPEYVVGVSKQNSTKKTAKSPKNVGTKKSTVELKLNHLYEDEDS